MRNPTDEQINAIMELRKVGWSFHAAICHLGYSPSGWIYQKIYNHPDYTIAMSRPDDSTVAHAVDNIEGVKEKLREGWSMHLALSMVGVSRKYKVINELLKDPEIKEIHERQKLESKTKRIY